ncbi:FhaA domain-containing protein [Collinsella tanakaei]|uniref:FhaA domain-containing protein n=1 Tax=Collinsella tanakaei TaxID=626935 RepID=UPI001F22ECC8|nr:DUF3662 and FHA domain-containing protein [Collinsella tanakaei]MCF2622330.1 DUF3662 and FHA domain-containing protein [Collinsella tanakaei]
MNFLGTFEDHVAGIFGAARAPFSFKKLAKQAAHEMEDQTLVVDGVNTAPALYTILISSDDDPLMAPYYPQLTREVSEFVRASAEKKRYVFVGEPLVRFMIDPSLKSGKFSVFAENVDAPTLGRLYEEERAYQKGLSGQMNVVNPRPAPQPRMSVPARAEAAPDPFAPSADDFATPIPVPKTITRDAMAAMGAAGAASSVASRMAGTRQPQPQPAAPLAQLVDVVTGDVLDIVQTRCTVGRERAAADVVLRDPNVSRRHAELTYTGSDWTIEDLNSTNGTLVNNRRITRCPLRDGDLLTFGLSTFEFRG